MVDGTQNVSRKEQMSVCVRYVDKELYPHEHFIGLCLYEPPGTTGEILAKCVLDVLLRLQLPISALRGQTYDGASNMSGQYKGCQALIYARNNHLHCLYTAAHIVHILCHRLSVKQLLSSEMPWHLFRNCGHCSLNQSSVEQHSQR